MLPGEPPDSDTTTPEAPFPLVATKPTASQTDELAQDTPFRPVVPLTPIGPEGVPEPMVTTTPSAPVELTPTATQLPADAQDTESSRIVPGTSVTLLRVGVLLLAPLVVTLNVATTPSPKLFSPTASHAPAAGQETATSAIADEVVLELPGDPEETADAEALWPPEPTATHALAE